MESRTICQETQNESCTSLNLIIGREKLVWAAEPAEPANLPQSPSCRSWENTWRMFTWADTHGRERICRSPAFPRGDSSKSLEQKNKSTSLDTVDMVRGIGQHQTSLKATLHGTDCQAVVTSSTRKREAVSECGVTLVVQLDCFSPLRVLRQELHDWREGGDQERGNKNIKRH